MRMLNKVGRGQGAVMKAIQQLVSPKETRLTHKLKCSSFFYVIQIIFFLFEVFTSLINVIVHSKSNSIVFHVQ